jgi:hypothetical protein
VQSPHVRVFLAVFRIDWVLDGYEDWTPVVLNVLGDDGHRPVHGWREVGTATGMQLPVPRDENCKEGAARRDEMCQRPARRRLRRL